MYEYWPQTLLFLFVCYLLTLPLRREKIYIYADMTWSKTSAQTLYIDISTIYSFTRASTQPHIIKSIAFILE